MSLVTRVSVAFLVALALALGGFSACLYVLSGLRLRLALDQELEATLDHFGDRHEAASGRVTWAIYDEAGRRVESTAVVAASPEANASPRSPSSSAARQDSRAVRVGLPLREYS